MDTAMPFWWITRQSSGNQTTTAIALLDSSSLSLTRRRLSQMLPSCTPHLHELWPLPFWPPGGLRGGGGLATAIQPRLATEGGGRC
jgi:hypothetical protein